MKGPITSSHIPVYQPSCHSIKQANNKLISNGFNAELQPSKTNPFQTHKVYAGETIASDGFQQSKRDEILMKPMSPPIAITSSSYGQEFSPNLCRKSSMNERVQAIESPSLVIGQSGFVCSTLQSSIRNIDALKPLVQTNTIQPTKTSPPLEAQNDTFTPRMNHLNYDYMQSETPIVTLEHQRIDHHNTQSTSPQMLHFQQIEERMVDQLNELYKATMLIHSNQRDTPLRLENDEIQQINHHYLQREPAFNPGSYRCSNQKMYIMISQF